MDILWMLMSTLASNFWSFPLTPRSLPYLTLLSYCHSQVLFPLWNKVLLANLIVQDYLWERAKWMHCSPFSWIIYIVFLPWLQNSYFSFIEDVFSQQRLHLRTRLLLRPDWNSAVRVRLLWPQICLLTAQWRRKHMYLQQSCRSTTLILPTAVVLTSLLCMGNNSANLVAGTLQG